MASVLSYLRELNIVTMMLRILLGGQALDLLAGGDDDRARAEKADAPQSLC